MTVDTTSFQVRIEFVLTVEAKNAALPDALGPTLLNALCDGLHGKLDHDGAIEPGSRWKITRLSPQAVNKQRTKIAKQRAARSQP